MRGPRHPIGAAPWIADERTTALHIAQSEVEEFMFSAKNELDWLNEHMAEIFSENQMCVFLLMERNLVDGRRITNSYFFR